MGSPLRLPVWVISLDSSGRVGQPLNLIFVEVEFQGAPELLTNCKSTAGNHSAAISSCAVSLLGVLYACEIRVESIIREIENAIAAGLYYVALVTSLSLPDVCAALESPDGETSGTKYKAWYDAWMAPMYPQMTSLDLYSLRCGLVHQGRMGHPQMQYARILFTVPNLQGNVYHQNILNDVLNLDAGIFCRDMIECVRSWYAAMQNDACVQANLPRLVQFRAHGLAPYMVGMPLIA
jgi:hypothetical protein